MRPVTLSALSERYDAIISDVWGVVHNGLAATPSAGAALARFREAGKPVVLLSNAPRPGAVVAEQLDALGVPRAAYDAIVTSGDLTRARIEADPWEWVFHLGPDRDLPLFEGLDLTFAGPDEADVAVITGLRHDEVETAADYGPVLDRLLEHDVPVLCANPDLIVERGDRLIPCAGALAELYEAAGGAVTWLGKPFPVAYEAALARLAAVAGHPVDPRRVLAIGDAVRTDLKGAHGAGLDALFLAGGIHAAEAGAADAIAFEKLADLFAAAKVAPVGVSWHLGW